MLDVKKAPQVTGIGFWRSVGGRTTSERGKARGHKSARSSGVELRVRVPLESRGIAGSVIKTSV